MTVNCTTLVYQMMKRIVGHLPLDYRLLFSGYLPEYVYGVHGLNQAFSLEELRQRGRITGPRQTVRPQPQLFSGYPHGAAGRGSAALTRGAGVNPSRSSLGLLWDGAVAHLWAVGILGRGLLDAGRTARSRHRLAYELAGRQGGAAAGGGAHFARSRR